MKKLISFVFNFNKVFKEINLNILKKENAVVYDVKGVFENSDCRL